MQPTPDHEIHATEKRRMKRRVVGTLTAVAAVYFLFLFPQQLLDSMLASTSARWPYWVNLATGAAGNGTLVWVLSYILFASDSAFKGSSASATWARSIFASHAAMDKYRCTEAQASALWFKFFDTWSCQGSSNRILLVNSYSATYSARAVFHLERALVVFLILSGISMLIHWLAFGTYSGQDGFVPFVVHLLVVALLGIALVFLKLTNRLPKGSARSTGCWARVEDVFGRSRAIFTDEVLRHGATLDDAFDRVAVIRSQVCV